VTDGLPRPLAVGKVLWGAFVLPWHMRQDMARVLAAPVAALLVFWCVHIFAPTAGMPSAVKWALLAMQGMLLAWLAVHCHRLVLAPGSLRGKRAGWTGTEWKYLTWTLVMVVLAIVTAALISTVVVSVLAGASGPLGDDKPWWGYPLQMVAALSAAYVFGRSSLVLPAVALGRRSSLGLAWRLSKGNGWRMAAVASLLPYLLSRLDAWLYGLSESNATAGLLTPISALLTIIEVVALSLAYRELAEQAAPVTAHTLS